MSKVYKVGGRKRGPSHIFLCTTSTTGEVSGPYTVALADSIMALAEAGIGVEYCLIAENCHVDDARNEAVREFLLSDCTDLVFTDADVGWQSSDMVALVTYDRDLVAGVYPKRTLDDDEVFPVFPIFGKPIQAEADGLVEVAGAPTGFMRIRRHVIEKIVAEEPRRFWGQSQTRDEAPHHIVFERTYADNARWSGDYSFCRRWRRLGGKVFVAPEMNLMHQGTKEWTGSLGDHWKRKAGLLPDRLILALEALKQGADDAELFVTLHDAWHNNWAAPPGLLACVAKLARQTGGPILETGSGLSTLVAVACGAEAHSLEHDPARYKETKDALEQAGLSTAGLHYAPIDLETGWYQVPEGLPKMFAVVLCDGPPRSFGNRDRLWTEMEGAISGAHWIVDDVSAGVFRGRETSAFNDVHPWLFAPAAAVLSSAA